MEKKYVEFIADLKKNIVQSRYTAAKLANKEQLLLYFKTGKMLSEKIAAENWGAKVLEKIAEDLQQHLPGIKGFSYTNLKNMRQFFEIYSNIPIGQSLTGQLGQDALSTNNNPLTVAFFSISFTHHILLFNKCKLLEERIFI